MPKSSKLDYQVISLTRSKNLCISEQYWIRIALKTDSRSFDFLVQLGLTDLAQDVVVHPFELNSLNKACNVGVYV